MEIYIVRHGDALPNGNDIERKLSNKGENQSKVVGKALKKLEVRPESIITSKLKRAMQTSEIIAKEINFKKERIEKTEILRPDANVDDVIEYIKRCKEKNLNKILLVGHMPSLGHVIEKLISDGKVNINLKKCSLCRIDFEENGTLIFMLNQNILKKLIKG